MFVCRADEGCMNLTGEYVHGLVSTAPHITVLGCVWVIITQTLHPRMSYPVRVCMCLTPGRQKNNVDIVWMCMRAHRPQRSIISVSGMSQWNWVPVYVMLCAPEKPWWMSCKLVGRTTRHLNNSYQWSKVWTCVGGCIHRAMNWMDHTASEDQEAVVGSADIPRSRFALRFNKTMWNFQTFWLTPTLFRKTMLALLALIWVHSVRIRLITWPLVTGGLSQLKIVDHSCSCLGWA